MTVDESYKEMQGMYERVLKGSRTHFRLEDIGGHFLFSKTNGETNPLITVIGITLPTKTFNESTPQEAKIILRSYTDPYCLIHLRKAVDFLLEARGKLIDEGYLLARTIDRETQAWHNGRSISAYFEPTQILGEADLVGMLQDCDF